MQSRAEQVTALVEGALAAKATRTGNPLRPAVIAASAVPYPAYDGTQPLRLLVTGGSQGARVMSDVVPPAIETLDAALRARLHVTQQARPEDVARVANTYKRLGVTAEIQPFFADLPQRIVRPAVPLPRGRADSVEPLDEVERRAILGALERFANNKTHTARALGISLKTLHNKLKRYTTRREAS